MNISKIQPNKGQIEGLPANPRIIKDERYQRLKQSIQEDPEMLELRELLVYPLNNEYIIIGGNMRYEALKELGIEEVPVKIIPKETSAEKLKAITIKDNIAYGQWDFDLVGNEWNIEELNEWGFEMPDNVFNPIIEPKIDTSVVTREDIIKEAQNIADAIVKEKLMKELTCPKCGHNFYIQNEQTKSG